MELYHGSSVIVSEPVLLTVQRDLDFGRGFYTTSDYPQAARWARRTAARLGKQDSYVNIYQLDDNLLAGLSVLRFSSADEQWLDFVARHRRGQIEESSWDVICGPVANDTTMPVLDLFLSGRYDAGEAVKRLLPQKLKDQWVFKTEKALQLLRFTEAKAV